MVTPTWVWIIGIIAVKVAGRLAPEGWGITLSAVADMAEEAANFTIYESQCAPPSGLRETAISATLERNSGARPRGGRERHDPQLFLHSVGEGLAAGLSVSGLWRLVGDEDRRRDAQSLSDHEERLQRGVARLVPAVRLRLLDVLHLAARESRDTGELGLRHVP